MTINITSLLKLPKPDTATPNWATYFHRAMDMVDGMFGKTVTVTKVTGATTLPDADYTADNGKAAIVRTTAVLTGNVQVNVPARNRIFLAENLSSGAFGWKIQTSGGNGVTVPQGKRMWLRSTTTGVIPISRTDGRATATEYGLGIITATHIASDAITTAKILAANVTLPKLAGAGDYGRIMISSTAAGNTWATLARGNPRQVLAMSTGTRPLPSWVTPPISRVATSTGKALSNSAAVTFSHGLTGITNKYDYKSIILAMECISTDLGYSVGDVLYMGSNADSGSNTGVTVYADSTSAVGAAFSAQTVAVNKSSFLRATLTLSRWVGRFIVTV